MKYDYAMKYNIEINKVIGYITKHRAKLVCIQLPDGLKQYANKIYEDIENKTKAKVLIWADSCFGGCDIPMGIEHHGIDLLIQWGHTEWHYHEQKGALIM